jgi:hypothetical protein
MLIIMKVNVELHPIDVNLYRAFGITFFTHNFDDMLQKRSLVHEDIFVIKYTVCIDSHHQFVQ